MIEPTEKELIESLNEALRSLGHNYTVSEFDRPGGETEKAALDAITQIVAESGKPAKLAEVAARSSCHRATLLSACSRLSGRGRLVGNAEYGYVPVGL